jgi:hypothetical protein
MYRMKFSNINFFMNFSKNNKVAILFATSLISIFSSSAFATAAPDCVNGSNTSSCNVPADVTSMSVSVTGAGGGPGGAYFSGGGIGGVGGGGANCTLNSLPVTAGQLLTISVGFQGAAGINGTALQQAGTAGGFGALSSVQYSGTTYSAAGGVGGSAGTSSGNGANGLGGQSNAGTCVGGVSTAGASGAGGSGSVVLTFSATPAAIPTLGEWAMIFMASLMAMFGIRRMRRSK